MTDRTVTERKGTESNGTRRHYSRRWGILRRLNGPFVNVTGTPRHKRLHRTVKPMTMLLHTSAWPWNGHDDYRGGWKATMPRVQWQWIRFVLMNPTRGRFQIIVNASRATISFKAPFISTNEPSLRYITLYPWLRRFTVSRLPAFLHSNVNDQIFYNLSSTKILEIETSTRGK